MTPLEPVFRHITSRKGGVPESSYQPLSLETCKLLNLTYICLQHFLPLGTDVDETPYVPGGSNLPFTLEP